MLSLLHLFCPQHDETLLREVLEKQGLILEKVESIMATLDEVLQDVTDESTQLDSIGTLVAGLKQQLADALAGTTLPPGVQAKVDAIFTQAEANKAKIATALNANVAEAPPSEPQA
jgi:predicted metal-dependent enzyme (double-stranded beta helix superfamily)